MVSIANFNNEKEINIYPNPTTGKIFIETSATEKQTVQIFDLNGRLVLSQILQPTPNPSREGKTAAIDAGVLNEGVYNLTIKSNEGVTNKKLVIVR